MTKKPVLFNIIPLFLFGIAASFYFQVAYLLDVEWTNFYQIHTHITLPNWIAMSLMAISAIAIYKGHHLTKWLIPVTVFSVFWNNYLVSAYGDNFSSVETLAGSMCFPLLFAPFYTKKNRQLLSDRRYHWWETAPRKNHQAFASINPFASSTINTRTFDVSRSGFFVQVEDVAWNQLPKMGERVNVSITLDTLRKVRGEAIIVRLDEAKGNYPRGMGLHFTELSSENRRTLNSFLDN